MLLRYSKSSPFARKILVMLHETGMADQIQVDTLDGWAEPAALIADNPLSMVPTLVLDDGRALYDSPVICEYIDRCCTIGRQMIPATGEDRWQVLREQALADGVLDSAVLLYMETERRPAELRWDWWVDLKRRAISRALDRLEADVETLTDRVDVGAIAIAVALGYLDFRDTLGDWRTDHPMLAAWYASFSQRPAMLATQPEL